MAGAANPRGAIMPRSLQATPCPAAPASTSARTPRGCSSREAIGARLQRAPLRARVHASGASATADGCPVGAEKIDEVAAVVARQVRLAEELGVASLRVVATAAVRQAPNRAALAAAIEAACGARLESSRRRTRRGWPSAARSACCSRRPRACSASSTSAAARPSSSSARPRRGQLVDLAALGSAVVTHHDLPSDPPPPAELARAREKLAASSRAIEAPQPAVAYAVGGSATSLQRLVGASLEREALVRGLQALVTRPSEEVALRLGLAPERARLLPAGSCCSTRRRTRCARRCSSPAAGCARASSSSSSRRWMPDRHVKAMCTTGPPPRDAG